MLDQSGNTQAESWRERMAALEQLDAWLRTPMLALSFAWLVLVVVELAWGSSPVLGWLGTAIWVVFVLEFLLRFALAPEKLAFLRGNWLTVLALLAPALIKRRLKQGKEDPARIGERRGMSRDTRPNGPLVWIHGASVGEVLAAAGADRPVREVARALFLSSGTVRNHLVAVTQKLGVPSRAEAYRSAREQGWI